MRLRECQEIWLRDVVSQSQTLPEWLLQKRVLGPHIPVSTKPHNLRHKVHNLRFTPFEMFLHLQKYSCCLHLVASISISTSSFSLITITDEYDGFCAYFDQSDYYIGHYLPNAASGYPKASSLVWKGSVSHCISFISYLGVDLEGFNCQTLRVRNSDCNESHPTLLDRAVYEASASPMVFSYSD